MMKRQRNTSISQKRILTDVSNVTTKKELSRRKMNSVNLKL
jgi:hypothetical protein